MHGHGTPVPIGPYVNPWSRGWRGTVGEISVLTAGKDRMGGE